MYYVAPLSHYRLLHSAHRLSWALKRTKLPFQSKANIQSPSLDLLPLSLSLSHELSLFRAETRTRDEDKSRHDRGKQQTEENYTERRTPSLKQQNSTTWSNRGQHHAPLTTFDFRLIDHAFAFNYNFALNFFDGAEPSWMNTYNIKFTFFFKTSRLNTYMNIKLTFFKKKLPRLFISLGDTPA
jgi:hypothetical protein